MSKGSKLLLTLSIVLLIPVSMGLIQRWYKGVPLRPKLDRFYANPTNSKFTKLINDVPYHQIPPFEFTDQSGNKLTEETFAGHIFVADFIFTTCPGICPEMTQGMKKVQDKMKGKTDRVMFLSHTVDPETDTPEVLAEYAANMGADTSKWKFATGSTDDIYGICAEGYKLSCLVGDENSEEEFDHSGRLVLVDRDRIVRGYYLGYDSTAVKKLMEDILILTMEYPTKKKIEYRVGKEKRVIKAR